MDSTSESGVISVLDIEAQLAANDYVYSYSLLFAYDPFTRTGIIGSKAE